MKKRYYNWFLDFNLKGAVIGVGSKKIIKKVVFGLTDKQLIGILYNLMRKHYLVKYNIFENCFDCEK